MKTKLILFTLLFLVSCGKTVKKTQFIDSGLGDEISRLEAELTDLRESQGELIKTLINENSEALKEELSKDLLNLSEQIEELKKELEQVKNELDALKEKCDNEKERKEKTKGEK